MPLTEPQRPAGLALIIDPVPMSRSVLAAQLKDFGIGQVVQCGRLDEARRLLQSRPFDLVVCEMDFAGAAGTRQSGQEFLEDVRRERLVPLVTVFIMVTTESAYAKVAEAAEAALDNYLLKPFTSREFHQRVAQSMARKAALKSIFEAIDRGDHRGAARECILRFRERGRYWIYAARVGAELLLRLELHQQAQQLLDAIVGVQALPWARLGLAQAQLGQQQADRALCTLELLIHDQPAYADAYDVMGRAQLAQGDFDDALATYERAAHLTPASVHRQQALGMLAYYCGDHGTATRALERAVALGSGIGRQFDPQALVLLAALHFRNSDQDGLRRCVGLLQRAVEQVQADARLRRMHQVVEAFDLMLQRQIARLLAALKALVQEVRDPNFDMEAACNVLVLLARLTAAELNLSDTEDWVTGVAIRFCGHRSATEMLARSAQAHPPFAELVHACHAKVLKQVQNALTHSVNGNPGAAFDALLQQARRTLNLKFVDSAQGVLQRYAEQIDQGGRRSGDLAQVIHLLTPANARAGHGALARAA